MQDKSALLPESIRREIDKWAEKYPPEQRQSAVLYALRIVQDHNKGWLSNDLIEAVASYLNMPTVAAFEVATFYSMYELQPVGKHKISVCTSISCMLCGSEKIFAHLKTRLGIGAGETTPDGKFTIKAVECLAACAGAPACMVGNDYHENMTPDKIDTLLHQLEKESSHGK